MLYYKDDYTDFIMHHNKSYPRYRRLARRALSYYLGDLYNPETLHPDVELSLRDFISTCVEVKVIHKVPYDWNFIENLIKLSLYEVGFTHLSFIQQIVDNGYHGGKYKLIKKHYA